MLPTSCDTTVTSEPLVLRFPADEIGTDLLRLDGAVNLANLGRGTQLFAPGDSCEHVFVLGAGRVKLAAYGPGGKQCLLHIVEPGEMFGEAALLGETERTAAAEVIETSSVTMIPARSILAYAEENPRFWTFFAPLLRKRIRQLEEQLQWVSFLEVEQRIAKLMIRWASGKRPNGASRSPEFHMSQRDLAGLIGATRETTSSALNRLQRDGCIDLRRRCVAIRSLERLRERLDAESEIGNVADEEPQARVHHAGD